MILPSIKYTAEKLTLARGLAKPCQDAASCKFSRQTKEFSKKNVEHLGT